MNDLAKRAAMCKHWRWMPGMRAMKDLEVAEGRVCAIVGGCIELALDDREPDSEDDSPYGWHDQAHSSIGGIQIGGELRWNHLPDLTDPATLGCLLALVREAWGKPKLHVQPEGSSYRVWAYVPGAYLFDTEAEALVAALEAAP